MESTTYYRCAKRQRLNDNQPNSSTLIPPQAPAPVVADVDPQAPSQERDDEPSLAIRGLDLANTTHFRRNTQRGLSPTVPGVLQPLLSSQRERVFELQCEEAPHFGDTHIHARNVFTGPVNFIQQSEIQAEVSTLLSVATTSQHIQIPIRQPSTIDLTPQPGAETPSRASTQHPVEPSHSQETIVQQTRDRVTEQCEQLQLQLREKVERIASEDSSLAEFSDRPILPVNLSIVSRPQQLEDEFRKGHYHRREDFVKVYERPEGDITAAQMFPRAKHTATEEAEKKFQPNDEEAKSDYIEKYGNVVGVVGQAGIGKTTSSKKWCQRALHEGLFQRVSYVFYIMIRRLNFKEKMTLLQFLVSTILPEWLCTPNETKDILNVINSDQNVLIIFDGLDESDFGTFSSLVPLPSLHSKATSETFLKNLSGGKLLPRARKVFTSRPAQLFKLNPVYRPKFIVQILGLTTQSQTELGRQLCGGNYGQIQEKLNHHSNLFAYCYVPVNFILTVNYLMNFVGDVEFVSITRVLTFTCGQYSRSDHLKGQECELDKLSKLAWDGFKSKQVLFGQSNLLIAGMQNFTAAAFLNTSVTKKVNFKLTILDGDKRIYFSHLIWQEFFTAVYMMMVMPVKQFAKQHKRIANDRWEVVGNFVFGICDRSVYDDLSSLITAGCSYKEWTEKRRMLQSFIASHAKERRGRILKLCSWAHEANFQDITLSLSAALPAKIDLYNSSLLQFDIENLSTVLRARCGKMIEKLILSSNKIKDFGANLLAPCLRYIQDLELCDCGIETDGIEALAKAIEVLRKPLKNLGISKNKFGDSGARFLACCLHNVQEIELRGCEIGSSGMKSLADKINLLSRPIQSLNLSLNRIEDLGATSLANCIHNIQVLVLCDCEIGANGVKALLSKIHGLQLPLRILNLSRNEIGDVELISLLASCIHNIQELKICECGIGSEGVKKLAEKIQVLKTPMRNLNLSRNKFGDLGGIWLARCIRNIQELELWDCGVGVLGAEQLTKTIQTLGNPLKMLDLSWNKIGDAGANCLAQCVGNIEELILAKCDIGNNGLNAISSKIRVIRKPMQKLDLSQNIQLTDEAAPALAGCVHNIQILDISWCGFEEAGRNAIKSKSQGIVYDKSFT